MKSFPSFLVPVSSISESYWLYLSNYVLRIHPLPLSLSADTSVNIISSLDFCCNFRNNLPASTPCSPPQLVPNMTTRSILLKLGQIISLLCSEASMGWFIIHKVKTKVILVSYRLYTVWFSLLLWPHFQLFSTLLILLQSPWFPCYSSNIPGMSSFQEIFTFYFFWSRCLLFPKIQCFSPSFPSGLCSKPSC